MHKMAEQIGLLRGHSTHSAEKGTNLLVILLSRGDLNPAANIDTVWLNCPKSLTDILRCQAPRENHRRCLCRLPSQAPIDDLPGPSIGLLRQGIEHETAHLYPRLKLCQGHEGTPILQS